MCCRKQFSSNINRSDFSLSLQYELALGQFPYPTWKNVFEQLRYVVEGEPPKVPADAEFSSEFKEFIHLW